MGIVTFRYIPEGFHPATEDDEIYLNKLNEDLVKRIMQDGRAMFSSTLLGNRYVIRFCPLSHRSKKEDIEEAVSIIERLGKESEEVKSK